MFLQLTWGLLDKGEERGKSLHSFIFKSLGIFRKNVFTGSRALTEELNAFTVCGQAARGTAKAPAGTSIPEKAAHFLSCLSFLLLAKQTAQTTVI